MSSCWQKLTNNYFKDAKEAPGDMRFEGNPHHSAAEVSHEQVQPWAVHSNNKLIVNLWFLSFQGIVSIFSKAENLSGFLASTEGITNCNSATRVTKGWISSPVQPPWQRSSFYLRPALKQSWNQGISPATQRRSMQVRSQTLPLAHSPKGSCGFHICGCKFTCTTGGTLLHLPTPEVATTGKQASQNQKSASPIQAQIPSDLFQARMNSTDMFQSEIFFWWAFSSSRSRFLSSLPSWAKRFLNIL